MTWGDLFITGGLFQTEVIVRCVGLRVGAAHVNGGTASCLSSLYNPQQRVPSLSAVASDGSRL